MHIPIGLSTNNDNAFWGIVSVVINAASVWIFTRWNYPKFAAVVAFFHLTHYIFDFSDIYFCERGHYWTPYGYKLMVSYAMEAIYFGLAMWVIFRDVWARPRG
ncbi:uncharacterized protein ASPGLDRAFT_1509712 [Aspergillus glaucus CBS 516.65]|uniref:EXPERA domain-containing protein n=1 Tax=Aspergillus glaucus CBS 516.65 TaxID=1160497 RepID=A0A1L9VU28_ASPGL|nr:hypothetical protein ASPGLDRAFT_1509712 [Aspergillus glaucus CBS 516.65]OJJ87404.1 hypothetical protein ASPGLDRAFT_1509712 [Aspergillus glaucus CBS 516.65]